MIWIGIDPGKDTGIVVRDGDRLIWHTVVEGEETQGCEIVTDATIRNVLDAVRAAYTIGIGPGEHTVVRIAAEGLTKPKGRVKGELAFISPLSLAAPAMILGAVRSWWPSTTMVPPGGHGSNWLAAYPPELVTASERRKGLNRPAGSSATIRHARSGWDIAGAATAVRRIELARAGAR